MLRTLADVLALSVVRFLVGLMRLLPRGGAQSVARPIVAAVFRVIPRLRLVARHNLTLAFPHWSERQREEVLNESIHVLADNLVHFAKIPLLTEERAEAMVNYQAYKEELAALRKTAPGGVGVLFPTMHFGSFELSGQLFALLEGPLAVLARGFGMPRLDNWWDSRRETHGNELFSRKGGYKHVIQKLKEGKDVTLLCDQNVKRRHAVFVEFFGHQATATKTVALAALRTGAPVMLTASIEVAPDQVEVYFKHIPWPTDASLSSDQQIAAFTQTLHSGIEEIIRKQPHGWFWIHRRWKTRPHGEPEDWYDNMQK